MSDALTGEQSELVALWREVLAARGWSHRELDERAGLGEGYASKILCGLRKPTTPTIAKINRALGITLRPCWSIADALVGVADSEQLSETHTHRKGALQRETHQRQTSSDPA